jgi:hypothetical protein
MAARNITVGTILADFATLSAEDMVRVRTALGIVATPREMSEASAHYVNADLACSAAVPCARTDLRRAKSAAIHGIAAGGHLPRTAAEITRLAAKHAAK